VILLITTCKRTGGQYLEDLIRVVDESGWQGPRFLVSDGEPPLAASWPTITTNENTGQMRTYWRALAIGLDQARLLGDSKILILEDDVELCRNALQYMERAVLPANTEFVTWFDGHVIPRGSRQGVYRVPARHFFCLQGVVWTIAAAEKLLNAPDAAVWSEPHRGDNLIAQILARDYYGVHVPNLVQHRGAVSICNPGQQLDGVRTANNYPGPEFDALTLIDRS
jgi:hypothetical protein